MSVVRGWCPSAHRPMMSGDGLLVRLRPPMARLTLAEFAALAELAGQFGNGLIDLTSRANLQIRGVTEEGYPRLLAGLIGAGLVPKNPGKDWPVTVTPFPDQAGETEALVAALHTIAPKLPELPDKMGVVVDTGERRVLADVSGDFRFERGADGLILRADGSARGRTVTVKTAAEALLQLVNWFVATGGRKAGRMHRHVTNTLVPETWCQVAPVARSAPPRPNLRTGGISVAFGQFAAADLLKIGRLTSASAVIFTPWRWVVLTDISDRPTDISIVRSDILGQGAFLTDMSDPMHRVIACAGAPFCSQTTLRTREVARQLAPALCRSNNDVLHVSGCAKGCARQSSASLTLVGRDGAFDLVENGTVRDTPSRRGLDVDDLTALLAQRRTQEKAHLSTARNTVAPDEG